MKYKELEEFIDKKMKMSHIYQPLLIKTLLDCGGKATVRQMACAFLNLDENNIKYYEKRIKDMPIKVLKKHDVIEYADELISLNIKKLTMEEKSKLTLLCEMKIQEYIQKRGEGTWIGSLLDNNAISGSVRNTVLERAGGTCELCGISVKEKAFDVDHIIPRSIGGFNTMDNLQALCYTCNRAKGNRSSRNYHKANIGEIKYYDKLVRDEIPSVIEKAGKSLKMRILNKKETKDYLKLKLFEEVQEFNRDSSEEEVADILEVVDSIISEFGLNRKKIEKIKEKKLKERGGFSKRILLEEVSL